MSADVKPRLVRAFSDTPVDLTAAGDAGTLIFPEPAQIIKIGVVLTTASATGTPVFTVDKRVLPESDTGRVAAAAGTLTKAATALSPGNVLVKDVSAGIATGDQLVFNVGTAATGVLDGIPFVVYYEMGSGLESDTVVSA